METKLLFVCTGNRDRSPTAEMIYKRHPDLNVQSAGTASNAAVLISEALLKWADVIVVMECHHWEYIRMNYPKLAARKQIFNLNIPVEYCFMDKKLTAMIQKRMKPVLRRLRI